MNMLLNGHHLLTSGDGQFIKPVLKLGAWFLLINKNVRLGGSVG